MAISPIKLEYKEGLSLINGIDMMVAIGALLVHRVINVFKMSDIIASISFDALMGKTEALEPYVHNLRPHVGQKKVAANLLSLLNGSTLVNKPKEMIQDAYTLRCIPQVHGASRDAFEYFRIIVEIETNSVTDNPYSFH